MILTDLQARIGPVTVLMTNSRLSVIKTEASEYNSEYKGCQQFSGVL
jgi:hypothetical protein